MPPIYIFFELLWQLSQFQGNCTSSPQWAANGCSLRSQTSRAVTNVWAETCIPLPPEWRFRLAVPLQFTKMSGLGYGQLGLGLASGTGWGPKDKKPVTRNQARLESQEIRIKRQTGGKGSRVSYWESGQVSIPGNPGQKAGTGRHQGSSLW